MGGEPSRRGASRGYRAALSVVCRLLLVALTLNAFAVRAQTAAIVASGLWNVVISKNKCNSTEQITVDLTYANGAYSVTTYTSNTIGDTCQSEGPHSSAAAGFYLSGQDLLSISQFQAMLSLVANGPGVGGGDGIQSLSFTSPDSVSGKTVNGDGFQMTRAGSTPTTMIVASGLWNIEVPYHSACNYTERGTIQSDLCEWCIFRYGNFGSKTSGTQLSK